MRTADSERSTSNFVRAGRRPILHVRLPIGVIALMLAIIPFIGAGVFVARDVTNARSHNDDAREIERSTSQLILVTDLEASLVDERIWSSSEKFILELGLTREYVKLLTGIDLAASRTAAITHVDGLIRGQQLQRLRPKLTKIRDSNSTFDAREAGYAQIIKRIGQLRSDKFASAFAQAADGGGHRLSTASAALQLSSQARLHLVMELLSYITAQFSAHNDPANELQDLIRNRDGVARAHDGLQQLAKTSSPITARAKALRERGDFTLMQNTINNFIVKAAQVGPTGSPILITTDLTIVSEVAKVFAVMKPVMGAHTALIHLAVADVERATADLSAAANREARRALLLVAALVLVSVAIAFAISRSITRPLRQLSDGARALRSGDSTFRIDPIGPREVQHAACAINDAAVHLELAERQARALATGDLDAVVLAQVGPGALGFSLQSAVQTLTSTLTQREEFRKRLAHEAAHDGLTRMPNRTASMRELESAVARVGRSSSRVAVLSFDLDEFKEINDSHGHHAGDVVLIEIGRRLVNVVRQGDHVGRLGGDEFVVIAEPVGNADEVIALCQRILTSITEPIDIGKTTVTVTASIGIALAADASLSAEDLLRDADLAVHKAKGSGRGTYEFCDEELRSQRTESTNLTAALREAMAKNELILYYQPVYSHATGELHAVEALVRWERPGHGMVFPDNFIPFAERSDLIIELDRWVLNAAARQMKEWGSDPALEAVTVAVNISGRHLASDRIVPTVRSTLQAHGVDPSRIIVEVTESAVLDDLETAGRRIQELRDIGIRVAIDDFGTGYTSIAHLRALPIDILKIDRSFVASAGTDPHSESIVKLIIDIGHLLGARITAEGIETVEQALQLTALGSDDLQGYLYAKPGPPGDLEVTIAKHAAAFSIS